MSKPMKQVATDLTTLEIYPHTDTAFHYFMGLLTVLSILPLSCLLLPVLIMVKMTLCLLYVPLLS
jgi:hypothetical protein